MLNDDNIVAVPPQRSTGRENVISNIALTDLQPWVNLILWASFFEKLQKQIPEKHPDDYKRMSKKVFFTCGYHRDFQLPNVDFTTQVNDNNIDEFGSAFSLIKKFAFLWNLDPTAMKSWDEKKMEELIRCTITFQVSNIEKVDINSAVEAILKLSKFNDFSQDALDVILRSSKLPHEKSQAILDHVQKRNTALKGLDLERAQKAFRYTYQNSLNSIEHFTSYIQDILIKKFNQNVNAFYALYGTVLQASGTGKSRLFFEAGRHYLNLVYSCVGQLHSSYPVPSNIVYDFLKRNSAVEKIELFFIASYFTALKIVIADADRQNGLRPLSKKAGDDFSFQFFWAIVVRFTETLISKPNLASVYRDNFCSHQNAFHLFINRFQLPSSAKKPKHDESVPASSKTNDYEEGVSEKRPAPVLSNGVIAYNNVDFLSELVIVFDEAKILLINDDHSLFRAMRKALRHIGSNNLVVIFTDTNSNLSNFAPPANMVPSSRPGREVQLLPPFYEVFSWDVCAPQLELITFCDQIATLKAAFSFGRPLWASYYLQNGSNINTIPDFEPLITYALEKLLFVKFSLNPAQMEAELAVAAIRFGIEGIIDHSLASRLMSSYMGVGLYIDEARTRMVVRYLPEPVLAEAACRSLHHISGVVTENTTLDVDRIGKFLGLLIDKCINGLVCAGEVGELLVRVLLSLSYDAAAIKLNRGRHMLFSSDVPLTSFLKELVSSKYSSFVKEVFKKDLFTIPPELKGSTVSFTQWLLLESYDSDLADMDWLKYLYIRRCAVIFHINKKGVDLLIPILLEDRVGFSYILLQVKNRDDIGTTRYTFAGEHLVPLSCLELDKKEQKDKTKAAGGPEVSEEKHVAFNGESIASNGKPVISKEDQATASVNSPLSTSNEELVTSGSDARILDGEPAFTNYEQATAGEAPLISTEKPHVLAGIPYFAIYMEIGNIFYQEVWQRRNTTQLSLMGNHLDNYPNHLILLGFDSMTISNHHPLKNLFQIFHRGHVEFLNASKRLVELKKLAPSSFYFTNLRCSCQKGCVGRCGCRSAKFGCNPKCACQAIILGKRKALGENESEAKECEWNKELQIAESLRKFTFPAEDQPATVDSSQ